MASLTIRQLDDEVKKRLRLKAAHHNRSMEAEARDILTKAVLEKDSPSSGLATQIQQIVSEAGGIELPEIERKQVGKPVDFSDEAYG